MNVPWWSCMETLHWIRINGIDMSHSRDQTSYPTSTHPTTQPPPHPTRPFTIQLIYGLDDSTRQLSKTAQGTLNTRLDRVFATRQTNAASWIDRRWLAGRLNGHGRCPLDSAGCTADRSQCPWPGRLDTSNRTRSSRENGACQIRAIGRLLYNLYKTLLRAGSLKGNSLTDSKPMQITSHNTYVCSVNAVQHCSCVQHHHRRNTWPTLLTMADDDVTSSFSSRSSMMALNVSSCNLTIDDVNSTWLRDITDTATMIDRSITPIWYIVGIAGNIISAQIWLRRRMRRNNSSAIYLATLSINDTLFLLLHILQELKYAWSLRTVDYPVVCEAYAFVYLVTQYLAPTLVLGFTVERFIAVCYPYQVSAKSVCACVRVCLQVSPVEWWHQTSELALLQID